MTSAQLTFRRLGPDDLSVLMAFLTTETWPFHGTPNLSPEQVRGQAESGTYFVKQKVVRANPLAYDQAAQERL